MFPLCEIDQRIENSSKDDPKCNALIDDDGNVIEVLFVANEYDEKPDDDIETEEYELLEVDNVENELFEVKPDSVAEQYQEKVLELQENLQIDEPIPSIKVEKAAQHIHDHFTRSHKTNNQLNDKENVKKYTRRSLRTNKTLINENTKSTRTKNGSNNACNNNISIDIDASKKKRTKRVKVESNETSILDAPNESDIAEGESGDEFPARDSDNEDWPSQETLDEFPKRIIENGLLLVKGKELMSMICK